MNQAPKADSIDICAMTAHTIDGLALSRQLRSALAQRAAALTAPPHQPPPPPISVRNKTRACQDNGLRSVLEKYTATLSQAALLERIAALNADPGVHGILVQMPLPKHIDPHRVTEA